MRYQQLASVHIFNCSATQPANLRVSSVLQPLYKSPAFFTIWRVVEEVGFVLKLGYGVTQLLRVGHLLLFHEFYLSSYLYKKCRW